MSRLCKHCGKTHDTKDETKACQKAHDAEPSHNTACARGAVYTAHGIQEDGATVVSSGYRRYPARNSDDA